MKRWFGIFFILILGLEAGTTASGELGQGYTYWSSFKPGTMVAFRYQSTAIGKNSNQIRFQLNSVDPDRAVIIQDVDTSTEPKALVKGIKTSLEFKAEEFARKKEDLFHGGLNINLASAIWGTEDEVQRSAEELIVHGTRIPTIKSHWDEDLRTIEARLNDSEKTKIKSFIEAISLCVTSLENPFNIAGRIPFFDINDPAQALAFVDEWKTIQVESLAALQKLREEYPKLRNIKLKYQR